MDKAMREALEDLDDVSGGWRWEAVQRARLADALADARDDTYHDRAMFRFAHMSRPNVYRRAPVVVLPVM